LADVVYDVLLDALVEGRLPAGFLLHDRSLAEDLQVSRTPVREALQRLQKVGLVEIRPGRYTRATPLAPDYVAAVAIVFGELIALAAERSTKLLTARQIHELARENAVLDSAVAAKDWGSAWDSGLAVTRIFVEANPNPIITELVRIYRPQVRRWLLASPEWKPRAEWFSRRKQLLEAASAADGKRAGNLLRAMWRDVAAQAQAAADDIPPNPPVGPHPIR